MLTPNKGTIPYLVLSCHSTSALDKKHCLFFATRVLPWLLVSIPHTAAASVLGCAAHKVDDHVKLVGDAVLLARLRAGHTPLTKAYANQLNTRVEPTCPS